MLLSRFVRNCVIALGVVMGLASCGTSPVSEEDRVKTGEFDGNWVVTVKRSPGTQLVRNWRLSCGDMRREFQVNVKDGMFRVNFDGVQHATPISDKGKFSLSVPLGDIATASGTSDLSIGNGDMKYLLVGNLGANSLKGRVTHGIAEFGYTGCTAKTSYRRA